MRALWIAERGAAAELRSVPAPDTLPEGHARLRVSYSALNYKDALAVTADAPIARRWPMIPGIDLVGEVLESASPTVQVGQMVLATGFGLGEVHCGGLAEQAALPSSWLVPLPPNLDPWRAMALGTAGLTALLALRALQRHGVDPAMGPLLVTGAGGGVGHWAVFLAALLGYQVVASSGRREQLGAQLMALGAQQLVGRLERPTRPLAKESFAAVIDAVGGQTLAAALPEVMRGGALASVGLAGGAELHTTVHPFILRGISLLGIDSVMVPLAVRIPLWQDMASMTPPEVARRIGRTIQLEQVPEMARAQLAGEIVGRLVVEVAA